MSNEVFQHSIGYVGQCTTSCETRLKKKTRGPSRRSFSPIFPSSCRSRLQPIQSMLSSDASAFKNVFELALAMRESSGTERFRALQQVVELTAGHAICKSTPALKEKFGVAEDNDQLVVCARELWSTNQVWWNQERTKKPQTFKSESLELPDSTGGGQNCDFCRWETLTAADTFGRVENESCITSSNLFKFAFPCHGLILFKHHHPLSFSSKQVSDLLSAAADWFRLASKEHSDLQHPQPLLLWNCLPRAGASQFHGHAQTTLTETPTPAARALQDSFNGFASQRDGQSYSEALSEAYGSVGLLRSCSCRDHRAVCYASLAPTKEMEIVVLGDSLTCPAFALLLHGALRTLIDQLAVTSFNVGILNISADSGRGSGDQPIIARLVSRGSLASKASDFGGLEVFGGASIGHTDPFAVISALDRQMQAVEGFARP